jgi:cyclohexyl-isocyanide hydratase
MIIGMLIFPDMTQLDFTGPYGVFTKLPGVEVKVVAPLTGPVSANGGLRFLPDTLVDNTPAFDVLFVPGGLGVGAVMEDRGLLGFVHEQGLRARYVTSVCTGALILGAAGLLKGYRATTQ